MFRKSTPQGLETGENTRKLAISDLTMIRENFKKAIFKLTTNNFGFTFENHC